MEDSHVKHILMLRGGDLKKCMLGASNFSVMDIGGEVGLPGESAAGRGARVSTRG